MLRRGERRTLTTKSVGEHEAEAFLRDLPPSDSKTAQPPLSTFKSGMGVLTSKFANLVRESLKPSSKPQPSSQCRALTPGVCANHDGAVLPSVRPFILVSLAFIFSRPSLGAYKQTPP